VRTTNTDTQPLPGGAGDDLAGNCRGASAPVCAGGAARDLALTKLLEEVAQREKDRYAIDTFLLDKARKHELISDHEYRELAHIRDQRNRFAHPGGASPSRAQVLAAMDTAGTWSCLALPSIGRSGWACS
jgi:hypothetical protein